MEEENVQAQEEVVEQEEQTSEESIETTEEQSEEESTEITLSKSEYKKLQRKALAYDANKSEEKKTAKPTLTESKTDDSAINLKLEKLELRAEGYSSDEIDAIMELGGSKSLKNPLVQSAIKAMRNEKKSVDATEKLSSKSPVYKKFTQEDLSKMSSKELEKILPKD